MCIGHVSPEAASDGPIGLVQNGDTIEINVPNRTMDVQLSDEEVTERHKSKKPVEPRVKTGYLARYARMVSSAATGAVMEI